MQSPAHSLGKNWLVSGSYETLEVSAEKQAGLEETEQKHISSLVEDLEVERRAGLEKVVLSNPFAWKCDHRNSQIADVQRELQHFSNTS